MLLVTPAAVPGELRMGFVLRTCEANGLPSPRALARIGWTVDLPSFGTRADHGARGPVCGFAGLNLPEHEGLPAKFWTVRRPRLCPGCLAEQSYWRATWGLSLFVACPSHRVRLLDHCHRCFEPLRWCRPALLLCGCGADLRKGKSAPAPPEMVSACAMLSQAAQRAWVEAVQGEFERLRDRQHRLWLLGAHAVGIGAKPMKLAGMHTVAQASLVVEAAVRILSDWPDGFHRLLDAVAHKRNACGSTRLTHAFGPLYKEIFNHHGSAFAALREAFDGYVRSNWSGQVARRNRRLSTDTVSLHHWVPASQAARELGWRAPRVRRAIGCGLLDGHVRPLPSGRTSSVVQRRSLDAFKQRLLGAMTQSAVCRALRVGKRTVRALVADGVLKPIVGPGVDGAAVWKFEARDVARAAFHRSCAQSLQAGSDLPVP